jgi:hypothetical protein
LAITGSTILAIALGKYKSVDCVNDTGMAPASFDA